MLNPYTIMRHILRIGLHVHVTRGSLHHAALLVNVFNQDLDLHVYLEKITRKFIYIDLDLVMFQSGTKYR